MHRTAFVAALLLSTAAAAAPDAKALKALEESKAAMGGAGWDAIHFVHTKVHLATSGLKGTSEGWNDARLGYFAEHYVLGPVTGADGYDGKTVWSVDPSGQVTVEGGEDAKRGAVNNAYQNAHGYWRAGALGAEIAYSGTKSEGARSFDVVRITPKDGRPADLWIDASTHVIDRVIEQQARETDTTLFSDYRKVSGVMVPFHVHQTNGQVKYDTDITVDSLTFEAAAPKNIFSPPPPPARDFGFTGSAKSASVPFKLINNHMYVAVKLNGKGPYEFLFDTGGRNVITPTIAKELGIKTEGALQGGGVGNQSQDVAIAKVDKMEVGGIHLENQNYAVIALESFGAIEGRPITGIFGYEVFKRFVVKTDYEHSEITFTDPEGFKYSGTGTRVPFEFNDSDPTVQGAIDGIAGKFTLDTGSRTSLDLIGPFVAKNDLVKRYNAKLQGVSGWGVGGPAHSWFVRAGKLDLGGVSITAPVVGLSQQTKGSFSDIYVAGNVGAGVLKRFNITWDYPSQQIFFEKNANYDKPDVFDRTGMWVNLGDNTFDVVDVFAGAPAAEAGLKTGDKIIAIDGKKAGSEISLPDFRAALRGAVGTKLKLDVVRASKTLQITVTLRDLV